MDDELRERVAAAGEAAALFNALKHDSDPDVGAIMGPLMGEHPEFRPHGDEIPGVLAPVVGDVAEMDAAERRERLGEIAPDRLAELEARLEDTDSGAGDDAGFVAALREIDEGAEHTGTEEP